MLAIVLSLTTFCSSFKVSNQAVLQVENSKFLYDSLQKELEIGISHLISKRFDFVPSEKWRIMAWCKGEDNFWYGVPNLDIKSHVAEFSIPSLIASGVEFDLCLGRDEYGLEMSITVPQSISDAELVSVTSNKEVLIDGVPGTNFQAEKGATIVSRSTVKDWREVTSVALSVAGEPRRVQQRKALSRAAEYPSRLLPCHVNFGELKETATPREATFNEAVMNRGLSAEAWYRYGLVNSRMHCPDNCPLSDSIPYFFCASEDDFVCGVAKSMGVTNIRIIAQVDDCHSIQPQEDSPFQVTGKRLFQDPILRMVVEHRPLRGDLDVQVLGPERYEVTVRPPLLPWDVQVSSCETMLSAITSIFVLCPSDCSVANVLPPFGVRDVPVCSAREEGRTLPDIRAIILITEDLFTIASVSPSMPDAVWLKSRPSSLKKYVSSDEPLSVARSVVFHSRLSAKQNTIQGFDDERWAKLKHGLELFSAKLFGLKFWRVDSDSTDGNCELIFGKDNMRTGRSVHIYSNKFTTDVMDAVFIIASGSITLSGPFGLVTIVRNNGTHVSWFCPGKTSSEDFTFGGGTARIQLVKLRQTWKFRYNGMRANQTCMGDGSTSTISLEGDASRIEVKRFNVGSLSHIEMIFTPRELLDLVGVQSTLVSSDQWSPPSCFSVAVKGNGVFHWQEQGSVLRAVHPCSERRLSLKNYQSEGIKVNITFPNTGGFLSLLGDTEGLLLRSTESNPCLLRVYSVKVSDSSHREMIEIDSYLGSLDESCNDGFLVAVAVFPSHLLLDGWMLTATKIGHDLEITASRDVTLIFLR